MGDWRLNFYLTLLVGIPGSGKSTFAFEYLWNASAACRFIFDDQGRDGPRLAAWGLPGVRVCFTAADLEAALGSRWVIFNPCRMFPDDPGYHQAFAFFCKWVYDASRRAGGKKFLLINEIWQYQDRKEIPAELALITNAGREENIELVCCTQRPDLTNASITGHATELIAFRLDESVCLRKVADLGLDEDTVKNLPLGSFVSLNRLSRARLAGKVF